MGRGVSLWIACLLPLAWLVYDAQDTIIYLYPQLETLDLTMITVPQVLGGSAPARPQYNLLTPASGSALVGQAGQTLAAVLQHEAGFALEHALA